MCMWHVMWRSRLAAHRKSLIDSLRAEKKKRGQMPNDHTHMHTNTHITCELHTSWQKQKRKKQHNSTISDSQAPRPHSYCTTGQSLTPPGG